MGIGLVALSTLPQIAVAMEMVPVAAAPPAAPVASTLGPAAFVAWVASAAFIVQVPMVMETATLGVTELIEEGTAQGKFVLSRAGYLAVTFMVMATIALTYVYVLLPLCSCFRGNPVKCCCPLLSIAERLGRCAT